MKNILNISIPEPCHQSWNEMTPEGHGRHCQQCSKVVTDFTSMSNVQIINYFATYNNVCGRFGADQLGSLNNQLYLENAVQQTRWKKSAIAASLFLATTFLKANAQSSTIPYKQEQAVKGASNDGVTMGKIAVPLKSIKKVVKGKIYAADDNQPLSGAIVSVPNTKTNCSADANGNFTLTVDGDTKQLLVRYAGYYTQAVDIDPLNETIYSTALKPNVIILGEPTIVIKKPHLIKRVYDKCIKRPIRKIFSSE